MARRKQSPEASTEQSATAVLGDEIERTGDEPEPTFPDSKAPPEPEVPADETLDVVYEPTPDEETPLEPETQQPKVDPETKAKNLGTALRHERDHGRRLKDELRAEREARVRSDAEAQRLREEQTRQTNRKTLEDAQDLTEALPAIKAEITAELEPGIVSARRGVIRISQRLARLTYTDYDDVLNNSGVADAIAIDAVTGKPKDPVMWEKLILKSEDPGEDAYALARAMLEDQGVTTEKSTTLPDRPRAEPARPVIEVRPTADRFRGVRGLAASAGREVRRLSDADIEKMTDREYATLPKHVRDSYLAGGRLET